MTASTLVETTPCPPAPARVRVRLTGRGQAVALVSILAGIFGAGLAFGSTAHGADSSPAPAAPHRTVVVQPGESLWAIARAAAPHRDPRVMVEDIRQLNALRGAGVQAGQQLLLP
jgi:Tfp pilus assembly protein FimV